MSIKSLEYSSFQNSKTFRNMSQTFGKPPYSVDYLIIAGGGGGSSGGGGAGGYRTNKTGQTSGANSSAEVAFSVAAATYTLIVGAGGTQNVNGSNTNFAGIESIGGGAGGATADNGSAGGSGGGGGHTNGGGTRSGGGGTANQGMSGGTKSGDTGPFYGASGGGASAVGANTTGAGVTGGAGLDSDITGSTVGRAGGGSTEDVAGPDGGGNRNDAGTANTGGGGGGNNATGGSGVIIFTVSRQATVVFSGGVTHTTAPVGTNTVYTVTAAGASDTVTFS